MGRLMAIVYNPVKIDRDDNVAAIEADEQSAGWEEPMWLETSEEDPGGEITARAVAARADVVIAAGGDGTVRAVAEALTGSGIALALLPSGTGNLLARNLDLTLDDLAHSIHLALSGNARKIDVGMIDIRREDGSTDTNAFLVMAGLGVDAKMVENTNEDLKKRVGWLAYVDAIARALRDKSQLRLRYSLDGRASHRITAHTLIIGNCGSLPANMLLLPDALIDDGLLDIVFLRPKGFIGWLQIWVRVAWENGIVRQTRIGRRLMGETKSIRALEYDRAETITADFHRAEAIELDGDSFGTATAIKTWIKPGALSVLVPAEPAA